MKFKTLTLLKLIRARLSLRIVSFLLPFTSHKKAVQLTVNHIVLNKYVKVLPQ